MEWAAWSKWYYAIMQDLGYDKKADIQAAELLLDLMKGRRTPDFRTIVETFGQQVSICGASDDLEAQIGNLSEGRTVIAAGSATSRLMRKGIVPDVIVSDLDGEVESEVEASALGALVFVHAHGDNMDLLLDVVPRLRGRVVPTVQCRPFGELYNFGGFTDGDRAYQIARHFMVREIELVGWDFDRPGGKPGADSIIKARKLAWARRILKEGDNA